MKFVFTLIGVLLVLKVSLAQAAVVALHEGAADPLTEGWVSFRGPVTTSPLINDGGFNAWQIVDAGNGQEGGYTKGVTPSQVNEGRALGWTLTGIVNNKLVGDNFDDDGVVFGFNQLGKRFWVSIGTEADGAPIASFTGGPSISLAGLPPSYHEYSVVYEPATSTADLFVNGIERISNFAGNDSDFLVDQLVFGSLAGGGASTAGYSRVKLEIAQAPLLGDANRDGQVNELDYFMISDNFFNSVGLGANGDVDFNGLVNGSDFRIWKNNTTPAGLAAAGFSAVPEPTGLMLFVAGALALLTRPRCRK